MNVLEKILEEIKEVEKKFVVGHEVLFALGATGIATEIEEIIRSHMNEAKDINVPSKDGWIDRKNLKEEIKSLRFTITGMRNGKTMTKLALEEYRKSILKIIDEQPTYMDDDWVPVEERLPEEGKEVLAQFVVRVVHTNNTVDEEVYIHPLYYENGVWQSFAGVPNGKVEAWCPLPEPYKPKEAQVAGHIMKGE